MPQRKPIFFKHGYYHVYNRGHNKQSIFLQEKDYKRYLTRIEEYKQKHPITILCYCLMPNHIHLILRQNSEESIDVFIHRLHTAYTMYFNKKYERLGAVFQSRFKAKNIDSDEYLLHASRYVHINPIELSGNQNHRSASHSMNSKLISYMWSSYHEYENAVSPLSPPICDTSIILNYFKKEYQKQSYQQFVKDMVENLSKTHLEEITNGNI